MKPRRVLIVEDQAVLAMDLEDRLIELGYEVCGTAASYEEALELVEHSLPELAILDIQILGDRDGTEVALYLNPKGIPFIYLTSADDPETLERAASTGPRSLLRKPVRAPELSQALALALLPPGA